MNESYVRKPLAVAIILLFFSVSVIPSTGTTDVKQTPIPTSSGNTLYVGGNGSGNYTKIQDAIDDASDEDTVYVYNDSSPYYENLIVDKSISLIGEDRNSTIIDGKYVEDVVHITADDVTVSGFTIRDCEDNSDNVTSLMIIQSDCNVISGNIFTGNTLYGINMVGAQYNNISGNIVTSNVSTGARLCSGIILWEESNNNILTGCINNNISRNIITGCIIAIDLNFYSNNNSIFGNTLTDNVWGIVTGLHSMNDIIFLNNISYNFYGISAINCINCKIIKNNFIGNNWSANFGYFFLGAFYFGFAYKTLRYIRSTIKWDGNYWNKSRSLPKPILGWLGICSIPWVQFDWHPAQEPYDIEV